MEQSVIPGEPNLRVWPYEVSPADVVVRFVFRGIPLGKQRPRFNRRTGRVYTAEATRLYERNLRALFFEQMAGRPMDGASAFGLRCRFFRADRQRIDCDNLVKAVSDAANKIVWKDDSQVVEVFGRRIMAAPDSWAEVLVHLLPDPSIGSRFCS